MADALTTTSHAAPAEKAAGVQLSFAGPKGDGRTIKRQSTAGGLVDNLGSLRPNDGQSVMSRVDLGALHRALQGHELVSEETFATALLSLLPGVDKPHPSIVTALFRAFDTDQSGEVDQKELIAGCQALCSGDDATKLRLAFSCFDKDGDGHITPDELKLLLRGTIEPAVSQLHAAIDFASFGADDEACPDLAAINEEAGGAAAVVSTSDAATVQVELKTKAGAATISVPAAALAAASLDTSALSLDAFLSALVTDAMEKYDADKNGMIESDEFVVFARENPFLSVWFGHLTEGASARDANSWKDEYLP